MRTWLSNWPDDLVGAQEVVSCNVMAASLDLVKQSRRGITEPWQIKESVSAEERERVLIVLECLEVSGREDALFSTPEDRLAVNAGFAPAVKPSQCINAQVSSSSS